MSDYLEKLAARTIGTGNETIVQPRLPTMYEPLSAGTDSADEAPLSGLADHESRPSVQEVQAPIQSVQLSEPAKHQSPPALPLEADTITNARAEHVFIRSPKALIAHPDRVMRGMDDSPEQQLPSVAPVLPGHERARPLAAPTAVQHVPDLASLDKVGSEEMLATHLGDNISPHADGDQQEQVQSSANIATQPITDPVTPNQREAGEVVKLHPRVGTPPGRERHQQDRGQSSADITTQGPIDPTAPNERESRKPVKPHRGVTAPPGRQTARHKRMQPSMDITTQGALDAESSEESTFPEAIEVHQHKIIPPDEEKSRRERAQLEPAKLDKSRVEGRVKSRRREIIPPNEEPTRREQARHPVDSAAQAPLDLARSNRSKAGEVVDLHLRNIVPPVSQTHRKSDEQIQVEPKMDDPQTSSMITQEPSSQRHASQDVIASTVQGKFEDRETTASEKIASAATPTISTFPSKPSLQVQGPVPALPRPSRRRLQNNNAPANDMNRAEQPPVIRVSIGRVEVRAVLPASPIEKVAPPQPRMSLDEYLQRQNEAKR